MAGDDVAANAPDALRHSLGLLVTRVHAAMHRSLLRRPGPARTRAPHARLARRAERHRADLAGPISPASWASAPPTSSRSPTTWRQPVWSSADATPPTARTQLLHVAPHVPALLERAHRVADVEHERLGLSAADLRRLVRPAAPLRDGALTGASRRPGSGPGVPDRPRSPRARAAGRSTTRRPAWRRCGRRCARGWSSPRHRCRRRRAARATRRDGHPCHRTRRSAPRPGDAARRPPRPAAPPPRGAGRRRSSGRARVVRAGAAGAQLCAQHQGQGGESHDQGEDADDDHRQNLDAPRGQTAEHRRGGAARVGGTAHDGGRGPRRRRPSRSAPSSSSSFPTRRSSRPSCWPRSTARSWCGSASASPSRCRRRWPSRSATPRPCCRPRSSRGPRS